MKYNMAALTDGGIILAATTKPSPVMFSDSLKNLTTYAGKKVTIGVGHFQIIDFFYDW